MYKKEKEMNSKRKATIIVGLIAITIITLMTACSSLPKQIPWMNLSGDTD
jgi:hypothetical protein